MPVESDQNENGRKRRVHKKSRLGCRNCKLRGVKCDESKPQCKKCIAFRVVCSYGSKAADLEASIDGTWIVNTGPVAAKPASMSCSIQDPASLSLAARWAVVAPSTSTNRPSMRNNLSTIPASLNSSIVVSDCFSSYRLDDDSVDRLGKFFSRTVLSIGTERASKMFQTKAPEIACARPYMMHIIQTLTAIHDRHLNPSQRRGRSVAEMYHLSKAAASYNHNLSTVVRSEDRDALWGTAMMLGIVAFASIDVYNPCEAWPYDDSESSDLEWLNLSTGKEAVWKIADPSRPDSIFYPLMDEYLDNAKPATTLHWTKCVPPAFLSLYGLEDVATGIDNPYLFAAQTLAPLLQIEWTRYKNQRFFYFIQSIKPQFRELLKQKDPRALLLLAYWYSTVCEASWWIACRAKVECQSICLYLEKYHDDEKTIMELLQLPKTKCGLSQPKHVQYIPWFGSLT